MTCRDWWHFRLPLFFDSLSSSSRMHVYLSISLESFPCTLSLFDIHPTSSFASVCGGFSFLPFSLSPSFHLLVAPVGARVSHTRGLDLSLLP